MTIKPKNAMFFPYNERKEPYHIFLERGLYVGGKGGDVDDSTKNPSGGFNGGGKGGLGFKNQTNTYFNGAGGGGSTDVRLNTTIESRIIVAAGGGGCAYSLSTKYYGGYGGDEFGGMPGGANLTEEFRSIVANQTYGYSLLYGQDGRDGEGWSNGAEGNGGAGGGYYGGTSFQETGGNSRTGGGGGSSFINKTFFHRTQMYHGERRFNAPNGTLEIGHFGSGFCRVTPIPIVSCVCRKHLMLSFMFLSILVYLS